MTKDSQIYNSIGQILFNTAPEGAKKVKMRVEISPENDHCKMEHINESSGKNYIIEQSGVSTNILKYLVELKNFYIENNLTNGQPIWHGCEVTLDIEKGKIKFDFKYEPMFDDE